MPIGVRDMVLPPMPTESPSRTKDGGFFEGNDLVAQAAVAPR